MKGLEKGEYSYKEAERSEREVVMGAEAREGRCDAALLTDGEGNHAPGIAGSPRELDKAGNDCPLCPSPRRHASPPHIHSAQ